MKQVIQERLQFNLDRVEHLVAIYEQVAGKGKGRKPPKLEDILRAATVLLHASVDDFVRSIELWRRPQTGTHELNDIPLIGFKKDSKFQLGALAQHRTLTVQDLIEKSVADHLKRATYNNPGEIKETLADIGVNDPGVKALAEALGPMMERRHHIVHQADRQDQAGRGNNRTRTISKSGVRWWIEDVRKFAAVVLPLLP